MLCRTSLLPGVAVAGPAASATGASIASLATTTAELATSTIEVSTSQTWFLIVEFISGKLLWFCVGSFEITASAASTEVSAPTLTFAGFDDAIVVCTTSVVGSLRGPLHYLVKL